MTETKKKMQERYDESGDAIHFCPYCGKKIKLTAKQMTEWQDSE